MSQDMKRPELRADYPDIRDRFAAATASWHELLVTDERLDALQRRGEIGTKVGLAVVGSEHGFAWPGSVALT